VLGGTASGAYDYLEKFANDDSYGYPQPDSSNKVCATNGQQGTVTGSADLCDRAYGDGTIPGSVCNLECIKSRCSADAACVGFGADGSSWRPVSSITSVGASSGWHTFLKQERAIECTTPTDVSGYAIASEVLDVQGFDISFTGDSCAVGYSGSPVAAACTSAGAYTLSGCTAIECTTPTDVSGYAIVSEVLEVPAFAISFTGDSCAAGYSGSPVAAACASAGAYTLSGCTEEAAATEEEEEAYTDHIGDGPKQTCTDTISPHMEFLNGLASSELKQGTTYYPQSYTVTCETWVTPYWGTNRLLSHCNTRKQWRMAKYCQKSCFDLGLGYEGDDCTVGWFNGECSNRRSPFMEKRGVECATWDGVGEESCNSDHWANKKFCQKKCFELGFGYDGDNC